MRLNRRKKRIFLTAATAALLALSACGAQPETAETPEPEETFAPVRGYETSYTEAGTFSAGFSGLCATENGFYAVTAEKTGENIPESVVNEAKRKGRTATNDGRYDIVEEKLWFLTADGRVRELTDYEMLPAEENTGGWKSFASVSRICAMRKSEDGKLETLESATVSGNSVPADRGSYDPAKNYYEYETRWYIRELSVTGRELSCRSVSPEDAEQFQKSCEGDAWPEECSREALGIAGENICSPLRKNETGWSFLIAEEAEGGSVSVSVAEVKEVLYEEPEQVPTVLTLAAENAGARLKNAVLAFNAEADGIVIELVEGESEEADLLVVDTAKRRTLAEAGALEDLYPYLDRDAQLSRHQFFSNLLEASEINGGLYSTCAGFTVDTAMGLSSPTGDAAGWTYDELLAAWSAQGIGTDAFDLTTTRSDVLRACLHASLGRLLNGDGTCEFRTEEFRQILSFARNFRSEYDYNGTWSASDASDLRLRGGRQLLLTETICSMEDAALCGYEFGGEFSYKGYPTAEGSGNLLTISTLESGENLAMSASCKDKEAAWQFLRIFFMKDYQKTLPYFPTNRTLFEEQLAEQMEFDYVLDKKGEIETDDKTGEPLIVSTGEIYLSNWTTVYLYPISENKAEKLRNLVTTATALSDDYEELITLIEETAEPFFTEQATLEETVERVQAAAEEALRK